VVRPESIETLKGAKQPAVGLVRTFQLSPVGPVGLHYNGFQTISTALSTNTQGLTAAPSSKTCEILFGIIQTAEDGLISPSIVLLL
jgi:hypothetical protein